MFCSWGSWLAWFSPQLREGAVPGAQTTKSIASKNDLEPDLCVQAFRGKVIHVRVSCCSWRRMMQTQPRLLLICYGFGFRKACFTYSFPRKITCLYLPRLSLVSLVELFILVHFRTFKFGAKKNVAQYFCIYSVVLLMEELLHHQAFLKIVKNQSDKLPTSTGERRISEPSTLVIEAPCQARTRRHKKARKFSGSCVEWGLDETKGYKMQRLAGWFWNLPVQTCPKAPSVQKKHGTGVGKQVAYYTFYEIFSPALGSSGFNSHGSMHTYA